MPGSIPITNTKTVADLTPLSVALALTDLLLLHRPAGIAGVKDFKLDLETFYNWVTNGLAPLASPTFTGVPQSVTPSPGDDSTKIATTEFVNIVAGFIYDALSLKVDVADIVNNLTTALSDVPLSAEQGKVLKDLVDLLAPLDNPVFTGDPQAPTPASGDVSASIATTEFVSLVAGNINQTIIDLDQALQQLGQIWNWRPNTLFESARTVNDYITAPDIVHHDGSLYLVTQNFTSGTDFSEKIGNNVVMYRLSMDADVDYLELVAGAVAPLFLNQEVGSYLAIRDFTIDLQHTLPNPRLKAPAILHRAVCNGDITSANIVTLYKTKGSTGASTAVATISFNTTASGAGMPGVFSFNDVESDTPTTKLVFEKGDILVFKLTTRSNDITWVRINMLGTYVPFISPHFDEYLGPGPFVTIAQIEFDGANGSTSYVDTTGRHSPVGYGGSLSTTQSVSGGSSFFANQDGRVVVDGYNVDHADFDFTGKDFSVITHIKPISIGNDYVWGKASGGNIGLNLKLSTNGLGVPVVYLWPMVNGKGIEVPDLLTRPGFTKVEVRRESGVWSLWIDDVLGVSGTDDCSISGWESGNGYRGFLIAGAGNDNRYSGYIDKFSVGIR